MVDQYRRAGSMPLPDHFSPADPDIQKNSRAYYPVLRGIHACLGNWLARHIASTELDLDRTPVHAAGGRCNETAFKSLPVCLVSPTDAHRHDRPGA